MLDSAFVPFHGQGYGSETAIRRSVISPSFAPEAGCLFVATTGEGQPRDERTKLRTNPASVLELMNAVNHISNLCKTDLRQSEPLVRRGELLLQLLDDGCLLVQLLQGSGRVPRWGRYLLECLDVRSVGHRGERSAADDKLPTVPINFNRRAITESNMITRRFTERTRALSAWESHTVSCALGADLQDSNEAVRGGVATKHSAL